MNSETALTGLVAVAAIGAALLITSPAYAEDVRTRDLDFNHSELATQKGAEELLDRIEAAARSVCRTTGPRPTIEQYRLSEACMDEAMANAVNKIASPRLDVALADREVRG